MGTQETNPQALFWEEAFARWATDRGVPDETVRAARAEQGGMPLNERLVLRGAIDLEAVVELVASEQEVSCPGCDAEYWLPEGLTPFAGGVPCPVCGVVIVAGPSSEALLVARREGESGEDWLAAELLARWAVSARDVAVEEIERARTEGMALQEALVLRDVLSLSDVMELMAEEHVQVCAACQASFSIGAGLRIQLAGVPCPECGEPVVGSDPDTAAVVLIRRGVEGAEEWFQAELLARWAIGRGVAKEEILAARGQGVALQEALVLRNALGLSEMMELLEEAADLACSACQTRYQVPPPLVPLAEDLPCPQCGEGRVDEVPSEPTAVYQRTKAGGLDLVSALSVLDGGAAVNRDATVIDSKKVVDRTLVASKQREVKRIGPYELVYRLGRGGMGEVWAARKPGERLVALKVLDADKASLRPDFAERFDREGTVLEVLDHPNVVRLVDRGIDEPTGQSYLALDFVAGTDLAALLAHRRNGRLKIEEGVFLIERCAQALSAAHAAGVIHRDIKPSNVLVTSEGKVKLTDFGIALASDVSLRLTGKYEVIGTPHYLAPEVMVEGSERWTPAADVYALGCLAFRVLSGRTLFEHKGVQALIKAHQEENPPSIRDFADIPAALGALVDRMLLKGPEERPTTAEISRELAGLVPDRSTVAGLKMWSEVATLTKRPGTGVVGRHTSNVFEVGQFFQHYRIQEELGVGGMGVVYRAFHTGLKKTVALKVLLSGALATDDERRRFLREAESAGALHHEAIVPVLDAGEHEGIYFLTMEFVEGKPLNEYCAELEERTGLLQLLSKVCDGVSHAHSRGVIHRDLKPDNILVDPEGNPHILDFGIAKKMDSDDTQAGSITTEGDLIGTLRYMPPEQAAGQISDVDVRSDVYALGAILYELVSGSTPFNGSMREILHQVLFTQPRAPSLNVGGGEVPWELDAICLKALEKERDDRYQSALELKRDVENYLDGRPITARRATLVYRLRKWVVRNKAKAAAVAAAVLLAVSLLSAYVYRERARVERRQGQLLAKVEQAWQSALARDYQKAVTQFAVARSLIEEDDSLFLPEALVRQLPQPVVDALPEQERAHPRVTPYSLKSWTSYSDQRRKSEQALATLRNELGKAKEAMAQARWDDAVEPLGVAVSLDAEDPEVRIARKRLFQAFLERGRAQLSKSKARDAGDFKARGADLAAARQRFLSARRVDKAAEAAVKGLREVDRAQDLLDADQARAKDIALARAHLSDAKAQMRRADVLTRRGKEEAAERRLVKAREKLLQAIFRHRNMQAAREAWVLVALARGELALKRDQLGVAEQQVTQARRGPGGRKYKGPLLERIARFEQRLKRMDRAARAFRAHRKRGDAAYSAGKYPAALSAYELALAARSDRKVAKRHALCRELVAADATTDLERRRSALVRAQALHEDPRSLQHRIDALGIRLFARAMGRAKRAFAAAGQRSQGWDRVASLFERALMFVPNQPEALRFRADAYAERDRPKDKVLVSVSRRHLVRGAGASRVQANDVVRFYLDRHEVTNQAYARFVKARGYHRSKYWSRAGWRWRKWLVDVTGVRGPAGWVNGAPRTGTQRHPVTGISFYEAEAYARWRRSRLPTEQEWLLAACFDPSSKRWRAFPWKKGTKPAEQQRLAVVSSAPEDQSPWGAFDLGLNAFEWVRINARSRSGVVRGLSWRAFPHDLRKGLLKFRKAPRLSYRDPALGFRLVRDVPKPPPPRAPGGNR